MRQYARGIVGWWADPNVCVVFHYTSCDRGWQGRKIDTMTDWFARPVLHVSSVEASMRFYVDRLGFTVAWRYDEEGRARVAQVDRGSCALILSDQWPAKAGKGLMFISLNVEPPAHEAEVAAVDALRAELEARGAAVKDGNWGYRLLVVDDLDGNQLFFPYPNAPQTRIDGVVVLDAP
jgi:catechol 2,3-dioxygenase-like lactoylglutathione lyase family enzyme